MSLLENASLDHIVNVASVRHLSPFRYPGGKTWFVPHIRRWLLSRSALPAEFVEPFAGGAIVGLTVAAERLADHVTLVELDDEVTSVWQTILYGDVEWLIDRIRTFELTAESIEALLSQTNPEVAEKAFRTIVKNRVNRGGILAPGAGRVRYGENGKGLRSRWYPATLQKRIREIASMRDRITFLHADGLDVLQNHIQSKATVSFIDPPYTAPGKSAGKRLYTCYEVDHEELFKITSRMCGDFLMTYENAESVRQMAARYGFQVCLVSMKSTHHAKMQELLISRDLAWVGL